MVWIPGGKFLMGSKDCTRRSGRSTPPVSRIFWMDEYPVTVADFRRLIKATGHVTMAQSAPRAVDIPEADLPSRCPVRSCPPPGRPLSLDDVRAWWS
jgi:sulfatase modifying factor 1